MTESDRAGASTGRGPSVRHRLGAALRRWRAPIVILPLVVGLGYSGVVGARLLWTETTPDAATGPVVVCWDGSEAVAADCPDPAGLAGLRWVFPSFRLGADGCKRVTFRDTSTARPLEYTCTVRARGGRAGVKYSQRSDLQSGLDYFANRYDGVRPERTAGGARLVYRDRARSDRGSFDVTVALTTYPFAVTVSADTKRVREAALAKWVSFRDDQFLSVRPPEDDQPS